MSQTEMFAHMRWHRAMHVAQSYARAQALCMWRRAMHAPRHYTCGAKPCMWRKAMQKRKNQACSKDHAIKKGSFSHENPDHSTF